ncbi:MAG TPA: SURF1 family protein [Aquiluna sp.]
MSQSTLRRWGPWIVVVVLFAIATSLLSSWQFSRRDAIVERIDQVIANYDKTPVAYESLDWKLSDDGLTDLEWTPVVVSGNYLPAEAIIVRNRPLSGQAGFVQLVPLVLDSGEILMIDRGWIQAGSNITELSSNPLPNQGRHELVVRLRAPEPDLGRPAVDGQLASINPAELTEILEPYGTVISDRYGRMVSESPGYQTAPLAMPMPSLNEGNHLSYALQWILFGLMAFAALFWAYRNDRRVRLEEQGLLVPKVRKKTLSDLDNEFEDQNQ